MNDPPRILGRTGLTVPPVWIDQGDDFITAGDWLAMRIGPEALDRRGDRGVAARLQNISRAADLIIAHGICGNDLKSGWPMHGLQRLREQKLCRYFAIETADPLEAEWIAGHTPVHAIIVPFTPGDMAARYRVLAVAETSGVAVLACANDAESYALQRATPLLCATIVNLGFDFSSVAAMTPNDAEALWTQYAAGHPEPPTLRGVHPPESSA